MRKLLIACGLLFVAFTATAKTTLVSSISVHEVSEGICRVTIKSNAPLHRHKQILFNNPPKMVIDITGAVNRLKRQVKIKNSIVKRIRTSQFSMRPEKVRIVLDLHEKVTYSTEEGKTLSFLLRSSDAVAAALVAAQAESVALVAATAESLRIVASLQQAVADSIVAANSGMSSFIASLTEGGLLVPLAAGVGVLLIIFFIVLGVRGVRKRKKEEADFEKMLAKESSPVVDAQLDHFMDDEDGNKIAEDDTLDQLENELAMVKEQAEKLTEVNGFEVSVTDTPAAPEEPVVEEPVVEEPLLEVTPDLPPVTEETVDEMDAFSMSSEDNSADDALEKTIDETFNIDEFQKAFSGADVAGAMDDAPTESPTDEQKIEVADAEASETDAFDLDATIAQLKDKMIQPPVPQETDPSQEETPEMPHSLDDVLDMADFGSEMPVAAPSEIPEPAVSEPLESLDIPSPAQIFVAEVASQEGIAPEPVLPEDSAPDTLPNVPVEEPVVISSPIQDVLDKNDAQESKIVAQLDTFHVKMEGYKKMLSEREDRLAKMVELNDKISRDMDDVQARLDASLQKLETMQLDTSVSTPSVPAPSTPAVDIPGGVDVTSDVDTSASVIDVVVDDDADFSAEVVAPEIPAVVDIPEVVIPDAEIPAVADIPAVLMPEIELPTVADVPEPSTPEVPAPETIVVDDVFTTFDTDTETARTGSEDVATEDAFDLPDFGALSEESTPDVVEATPPPEAPVVAPPPAPVIPKAVAEPEEEPKFKKVFRLTDEGLDAVSVAQQLGIGRGQVDLFLKLREKGKMS